MSSAPSYDQANLALEALNDKLTALAAKDNPQEARKAIPIAEIESIRNNAEKIADFLDKASEEEQVKFIAQAMDKYEAVQLLNKLNLMLALEEALHKKDKPSDNELLTEVEAMTAFNKVFDSVKDIFETLPARFEKAQYLYEHSHRADIIAKIDGGVLSEEWLVHQINKASESKDQDAVKKYTEIYQEKFGDFKPEEHQQQLTEGQILNIKNMDEQVTPVPTQEDLKNHQDLVLAIALISKIAPELPEKIKDVALDKNDPDFKQKELLQDILSNTQKVFAIAHRNLQLPPAPPTPQEEKQATQKKSSTPKPKPESKPKERDDLPSSEVFSKKSAVTAQIEEMSQKKKNDDGNIKPSNVKPQPAPNTPPPPPPTVEVVENKKVAPQPHNENIGTTPATETKTVVKTVVIAATAFAATAHEGVMSARERLSKYLQPSNDNSMKPRPPADKK